jgi:sortase B
MFKIKNTKLLLIIALVLVLCFGAFFIYYVHEYATRLRDERVTLENTEMTQAIFQRPMEDVTEVLFEILVAEETHEDESDGGEGEVEESVDLTPFLGVIEAFDNLRELTGNGDIVAYIYIPGTVVSYVVVHGTDNSFYLNRDIFGNSNAAGTIFLDYLNSPSFTDPNTIVYGHNMNNGTKFHTLRQYVRGDARTEFLEAHPNILIVTESEVLVYEIFSVLITNIHFDYTQVDFYDGEFDELVEELTRRSVTYTNITATAEDNLLLLSTCDNWDRNSRIVIASRLAQRLQIPQTQ